MPEVVQGKAVCGAGKKKKKRAFAGSQVVQTGVREEPTLAEAYCG